MDIDMNKLLQDMLDAMKASVKDDWKFVKNDLEGFLNARQERLELLVEKRLNSEISDEFFKRRLADEKDIGESEAHAVAIIGKVAMQNAANAAIAVLEKAVMTALHF